MSKRQEDKFLRPKRYNKKFKLNPYKAPELQLSNDKLRHNTEQATSCEGEHGTNYEPFEESDVQTVNNAPSGIESFNLDTNDVETQNDLSPEDPTHKEQSKDSDLDFEQTIEQLLADIREHHIYGDDEEFEQNDSDLDFNDDDEENLSDTENDEHCPSNSDNQESGPFKEKPIYHGHSMTVSMSLLLILLYSITHSISGSQLNDLLTLIGLHCMETHPGLKSLFHFKKHYADLKSPLVKHYYCAFCLTLVDKEIETCSNNLCERGLTEPKSKSYFIEVPVEAQLQNLFQRPHFINLIQQRFTRKKNKESNLEDIYDGEIYKNLSRDGGVLSSCYPYNISFTLNTDGVPIFKSSKYSIWPIYLMINELPFKYRKQSENMIFCGLWFGDSKPFMATYSHPIHKSLKKLEENGINIFINGVDINCKAFLLCITADLPAKSLLMNMTQFNGSFSCPYCCERGETFKTTKGGSVHIFPFNTENPSGEKRNIRDCILNAVEASVTKKAVNGIKGPSFLMGLKNYDFIKGASIDYMHCVLLGITKLLIKLWISSPFSNQDFSISQYSDLIDKRLHAIKPPSFVTRVPRSISTHFKYWKASEMRNWLFFYSLPILCDLMQESYLVHYAAFVEALHLLCGSSISTDDIAKSQKLLTYFVMAFGKLYDNRYLTLNLHLLLHLPDCVRNLGPLWAYSCFSFETANGDITKLFHGTQNVDLQILSSVNIIQVLPGLISSAPSEYDGVIKKLYPGRLSKQVANFHVQFLGKGYDKVLSQDIMMELINSLQMEQPNVKFYSRILLRGRLYHSKDYTKVSKRNNFTVKYFSLSSKLIKYGFVQFYCRHDGLQRKIYAFIAPAEDKGPFMNEFCQNSLGIAVPHIHPVKHTSKTEIVEIDYLIDICVNITIPNHDISYICEAANSFETD